jgi:iron complex transport system substrate-binding protein
MRHCLIHKAARSFSFRPHFFFVLLLVMLSGCRQPQHAELNHTAVKPRIVSLAPSLTEMIYAIGAGDHLVGKTSACDWPVEVKRVPVVGAFGRPSLEMLASIAPDLVVDVDLADEQTGKKITALNIHREEIRCKSPEDIPHALTRLGILTGHQREADSLAGKIADGLAAFKKEAAEHAKKPAVYLEIWDDPLWTGGKNSFTSSLISYAGGYNIGDVVGMEYFEISSEWVIRNNPDVICCMYMSRETPAAEKIRLRTGWSEVSAVRSGRIYDKLDNNIFLRPGPRILEGIARMKEMIRQQ